MAAKLGVVTGNSLSNWNANKQLYVQEVRTAINNNELLDNTDDSGMSDDSNLMIQTTIQSTLSKSDQGFKQLNPMTAMIELD